MNSDSETGSVVAVRDDTVKVIDVPDLVNLIADFCDDESISKLSRVRKVKNL
jgi:hypothetical protein